MHTLTGDVGVSENLNTTLDRLATGMQIAHVAEARCSWREQTRRRC